MFNKKVFVRTLRVSPLGFVWLSFTLICYCRFLITPCYPWYFFVLGWGLEAYFSPLKIVLIRFLLYILIFYKPWYITIITSFVIFVCQRSKMSARRSKTDEQINIFSYIDIRVLAIFSKKSFSESFQRSIIIVIEVSGNCIWLWKSYCRVHFLLWMFSKWKGKFYCS